MDTWCGSVFAAMEVPNTPSLELVFPYKKQKKLVVVSGKTWVNKELKIMETIHT